jgi:zeta-carotene desaturase
MQRAPNASDDVLILGAGLAGLAAGVHLADQGVGVTLIETRKAHGGRAGSFEHRDAGLTLDNCQHVLMRCCGRLRSFLDRLAVGDQIDWHRTLHFADGDGRIETLIPAPLPAPLHFLPALWRWRSLTWRDRLPIMRAMHGLWRMAGDEHRALNRLCFKTWLDQHNQTDRAVRRFWQPVIVGACNERLDRVSARYAAQVIRDAFLGARDAYQIGLPRLSLRKLYQPAVDAIRQKGGTVRFGEAVQRIECAAHNVDRVVTTADTYGPRSVISALPFERLTPLVDSTVAQRDRRFDQARRLEHSPIIGIHLFVTCPDGQPVFRLPYLALTESPLHWVFNKGMQTQRDGTPAQCLHGVISAAYDLVEQDQQTIRDLAIEQIERIVNRSIRAEVREALVVKERRATFAARAGVDHHRPEVVGPTENLYLAGDWVATDWPATMEGAVRSGEAAADAVLAKRAPAPALGLGDQKEKPAASG